jgi:hypothetical protein
MQGALRTGTGEAAEFVGHAADTLEEALGFAPFHGTLNVDLSPPEPSFQLDALGDDHCDGVDLTPCRVWGVRAAVLRPLVPGYPDRKTEVVAPVHLRSLFRLEPGDTVALTVDGTPRLSDGHSFVPALLDSFEVVVVDPSGLSLALRDTLPELDAQVALWTPERSDDGGSPSATMQEAADTVIEAGGDSRADRLQACFDRLDTTPGNGVFVANSRADVEAAHELGVSVLCPDWL